MRPGIDPKIDYAFKRLFGREQNETLLIHLLNAVLQLPPGEQVASLELLNPFNDKDALDDKLSILDIKARDQRGRQFNVEMQMLPDPHFPKRVVYYLAKLHQSQLHEGDEYKALRPTVSISFVNKVRFPQVPDYHLRFCLLGVARRFAFTDDVAVHILELPKFTKSADQLTDPLDVWLYFLRHAETLDTAALPPALQVPEIQRAMGELIMVTQSDLERERYEARVKWQRDEMSRLSSAREEALAEGRAEGLAEGRAEGRREEALKRVHFCERLLRRPPTPTQQLLALPPEELNRLVERLEVDLTELVTRATANGAEPAPAAE
jgi:predicted transposase/invertase (TIGR01784 family)